MQIQDQVVRVEWDDPPPGGKQALTTHEREKKQKENYARAGVKRTIKEKKR